MEDLKRTTVKGYWWLGRRLLVRMHVAAYILQKISDFLGGVRHEWHLIKT